MLVVSLRSQAVSTVCLSDQRMGGQGGQGGANGYLEAKIYEMQHPATVMVVVVAAAAARQEERSAIAHEKTEGWQDQCRTVRG